MVELLFVWFLGVCVIRIEIPQEGRKMIKKMYSLVMVSALLAGVFIGTSWAHQQVAVVPLNTGSKSAAVPQTGQTSTVPLDVSAIDGADGQLGKGVAWTNPRFTDNGNGTVTDNLTGLVWLQNADCASGKKSWTEALAFAHALYDGWSGDGSGGDCGLDDGSAATQWRLPNVLELQSLIAWQYSNPALSNDAGDSKWTSGAGSAFTSVQLNYYWSSTTYAGITDGAWYVGLNGGFVVNGIKSNSYYVWPVRD